MSCKKTEKFSETWFFKWILNNQAVVAFFILLLIGLTVLIFTKISPIFSPVIQFMTIIMLPLVISMLLYYLIKPLVLLVERTGLNRTMSILVIYAILGLLLVWGISTAIPSLQNQILILMGKESWERKMKTIAICNHKGGVGKTALSMAIAEGLHRKGKRTLLVDLDQFS